MYSKSVNENTPTAKSKPMVVVVISVWVKAYQPKKIDSTIHIETGIMMCVRERASRIGLSNIRFVPVCLGRVLP